MAGEDSGDTYGALLATALRQATPDVVIRGTGGHAMARAGVDIMVDSSELGVIGIFEVLTHIRTLVRIFNDLVKRARVERPDAVVLIDYPGFNLRFAKRLKAAGIPVVYYVSPQVWAWGKGRVPKIARLVDKMLVIFPFETQVYAGTGLDVEFVGHPLLEVIPPRQPDEPARDANTVLLLPGSRFQEVDRLFPVMVQTAVALHAERPELRFVVPVPRERIGARVRDMLPGLLPPGDGPDIRIEVGQTREWLRRGTAALAKSGTVTVEAAISGLPLVVVYRVNPLSYMIGRPLLDIRFFTMVNVILDRLLYEEFEQDQVTVANCTRAMRAILPGGERRQLVEDGMAETVARLGGRGQASAKAAAAVLKLIGAVPRA
jgi:lipid-A-disaccharide synthase